MELDLRCNCKACTDRTEETYTMGGRCFNCGWIGTLRLRKGDRPISGSTCPHCGCSEVRASPDDKAEKYRVALTKIAAFDVGNLRTLEDEIAIWRLATDAIDSTANPEGGK